MRRGAVRVQLSALLFAENYAELSEFELGVVREQTIEASWQGGARGDTGRQEHQESDLQHDGENSS